MFANAARQAERYRSGRVLLAGDSAHINAPAGGVGLNVGIQDAMNLGWKLAAVVQGRAPLALLDTYHAERHPVGADMMAHTQAQDALITAVSPQGQALRALLNAQIATNAAFSQTLAAKLSALDVAYPPVDPAAHPLVGTRAAGEELFALLHDARPVLLNLIDVPLPAAAARAAALGVHVHAGNPVQSRDPAWPAAGAALIRPDGHVWWAADAATPQLDAEAATALQSIGVTFGARR